jgi:uncharacterized protein
MIHIHYTLKESKIHRIGLFAAEPIKKGQLIYTPSPLLDLNLTQEQFDSLDQKEKDEVIFWGFSDKPRAKNQRWHVDFDVSKFINHSKNANLTQEPGRDDVCLVALRDIAEGEELTQNYLEYQEPKDLQRQGIKD